jgi:altronate dehydratase
MSNFFLFKTTCILFLAAIQLNSCKQEDDLDHQHNDDASDKVKPTVVISTPSSLQMYNNGDTIKIRGLVSDASLHKLLIKIVKDSDNSVLYSETPTVHDLTTYTLSSTWKSAVTDHTNASVIVVSEDHNSNVGSDTVNIHIMP